MQKYLKEKQVILHPYAEAYAYVSKWNNEQKAANKDKHRVSTPSQNLNLGQTVV